MSKQIQPVNIWKDGSLKTATQFSLISINDNLESSATFYYQLMEEVQGEDGVVSAGAVLSVGNLSLSGEEYDSWDGSNSAAYTWSAGELNIVLV
jgi:hypothetical protein